MRLRILSLAFLMLVSVAGAAAALPGGVPRVWFETGDGTTAPFVSAGSTEMVVNHEEQYSFGAGGGLVTVWSNGATLVTPGATVGFEDPLVGHGTAEVQPVGVFNGKGSWYVGHGGSSGSFQDPLVGIWGNGNIGFEAAGARFIWGNGNIGYESGQSGVGAFLLA